MYLFVYPDHYFCKIVKHQLSLLITYPPSGFLSSKGEGEKQWFHYNFILQWCHFVQDNHKIKSCLYFQYHRTAVRQISRQIAKRSVKYVTHVNIQIEQGGSKLASAPLEHYS